MHTTHKHSETWTATAAFDRFTQRPKYSFTCLSEMANWRAPWKNRISSTTTQLRKSLVKPVMQQNISSWLVLPPEFVMHDAFNVILWMSADIGVVVQDDLGWKNRTTQHNCRFSATSMALQVIFVRRKRPPIYVSGTTISGGRTKKHVVIGFGELAAVD